MIGKITTGASFYHCLAYCLQDKMNLSEEEKEKLSQEKNLQHKDRAEILSYNNCFGNARELSKQFKEVSKLSSRVEKPVLHISLRLAPGEVLTKNQWAEIGKACAEEFGIDQNQFICVLHKDTREQHIHIVANRVGYDGRAVSLSNNYRQMANFCRKIEKELDLQEVLSPRSFLPKNLRNTPRQDARKKRLQNDIRQVLRNSSNYIEFEQKMNSLGYQVLKGRGISFVDNKKVKIKGSEVGFPLAKIEKILDLQKQIKSKETTPKVFGELLQKMQRFEKPGGNSPADKKPADKRILRQNQEHTQSAEMEKNLKSMLEVLLKADENYDSINPELLKEAKKRKKKLRRGL